MALTFDLQFFAEKTEKATPRKKQEARKKGQVAKSTDLSNAVVLLSAFSCLAFFGGRMAERIWNLFRQGYTEWLVMDLTEKSVPTIFLSMLKDSVIIAAPLILLAWLGAFASTVAQVGFLAAPEAIKMDLKKINPVEGAKRLFSMRTIVEFIKSILKLAAILIVAGIFLWQRRNVILQLPQMEPLNMAAQLGSLAVTLGLVISAVYLVIGVADLVFQRYDHAKKLRMSKQDIKDEFKKTEGDPLIKHRIKEKQRQISSARMMQEVPKAQAVVVNPTHFAVAIAYEAGKMAVPVVTAKGADFLALKMKEIAKEHGVVVMENKPLARALYASVEVGQEIPEDLFKAVAEVLAYVYKVKGTLSGQGGK